MPTLNGSAIIRRVTHPKTSSKSLPERWRQGRRRAAISSIAALTLLTGMLQDQSNADRLDAWWLRARFSMREWLDNRFHGPQVDPQIALVEIDDKSIGSWKMGDNHNIPEPAIAWGKHIAAAINQLNRSGARLIALDWTQPVDTDTWLKWDHDYQLGLALSQAKRVVFVKFIDPAGGYILPAPSILFAVPDAYKDAGDNVLGFAELLTQDSIQTSILPEIEIDGSHQVSFAGRIAEKSGLKLPVGPGARDDGSLLINYSDNAGERGKMSPLLRMSIEDVASAKLPDKRFKDKIVMIGTTYKGTDDVHYVPFMNGFTHARKIPGVEVQANAVSTLLNGDAIDEPEGIAVWFLSDLVGSLGITVFALWSWGRAVAASVALFCGWMIVSFILFVTFNFALPVVVPLFSLFFGIGMMGGYRALSEERERAQVMKIWGRHQDPRLIQELLDHPEWQGGQGQEVLVTVLFADLKNFTKTVESLSPTKALEALNRYLALLSSTILDHGGVVDKYLGDGLMAQWGAPNARPDHASAAVAACLDIEKRVQKLTDALRSAGEVSFEVRLTLHTGPVVAGPLGSEQRLEYTIIGDTVNVTSRLQETAKALGCDFLISETTYEALDGCVNTGRETDVEIRGRHQPLRVFEVLDDVIRPVDAAKTARTSQ